MNTSIVRGAHEMIDFRGSNKKETVMNIFNELNNNDIVYEDIYSGFSERRPAMMISKSIPNLKTLSLPLQEILREWNNFSDDKYLKIHKYGGVFQLCLYNLEDAEEGEEEYIYDISREEVFELLNVMVDLDIFNVNGWKFDGTNNYFPNLIAIGWELFGPEDKESDY